MNKRKALNPDTRLSLGGTVFRIDGLEGMGGSALVYRASYPDSLNTDLEHHVFIKELFPWTPDDSISRAGDGSVCCRPAGREIFSQCSRRFREGNGVNLRLLSRRPEQISGNLNSFATYGTYYSVLPVHGGETLQRILSRQEASGSGMSLRETLLIACRLLDALECFHTDGLLHLGVSPDNIVVLPEKILLIDYDSVCRQGCGAEIMLRISEKEGYTAPEVLLRELPNIGTASDLYAVAAVLYRMLAGRRYNILSGTRELKTFAAASHDLAVFRGEQKEACRRTAQIIRKGLHTLSRKRYQTTQQMRMELEEVLRLLD